MTVTAHAASSPQPGAEHYWVLASEVAVPGLAEATNTSWSARAITGSGRTAPGRSRSAGTVQPRDILVAEGSHGVVT
jgi:hypothetical protein